MRTSFLLNRTLYPHARFYSDWNSMSRHAVPAQSRQRRAGYVRSCRSGRDAPFDVDAPDQPGSGRRRQETLVVSSLSGHLPECNCETSARHPACVRAALAHLLVVLREAGAIRPKPQDETAVGEELRLTTST